MLGIPASILVINEAIAVTVSKSSIYAFGGSCIIVARRLLEEVRGLQDQILAISLEQNAQVLSCKISDLIIGMVNTFGYKDKWDL